MKQLIAAVVIAAASTQVRAEDNQWVLVHEEDASGGKRFARARWADDVRRLYLWGPGGKRPARNVCQRYELESLEPAKPVGQPEVPEGAQGQWTVEDFPPSRI